MSGKEEKLSSGEPKGRKEEKKEEKGKEGKEMKSPQRNGGGEPKDKDVQEVKEVLQRIEEISKKLSGGPISESEEEKLKADLEGARRALENKIGGESFQEIEERIQLATSEEEIEKLRAGREILMEIAEKEGWFRKVDEYVAKLREEFIRGQVSTSFILEQLREPYEEPPEIPSVLKGTVQERLRLGLLEILKRREIPEGLESQEIWFRERFERIRKLKLAPEVIVNHPYWIELTTLLPYCKPEVQLEFTSRLRIFLYAQEFRHANGIDMAIARSPSILMSHIGKMLSIKEIGLAYDLIDRDASWFEKGEYKKWDSGGVGNWLLADTKEKMERAKEKIAREIAKHLGRPEDEWKNYLWAVEEADDLWHITFQAAFRDGDKDRITQKAEWFLSRLYHYEKRMRAKGFPRAFREVMEQEFIPGKGPRGLGMQTFFEYVILAGVKEDEKDDKLLQIGFERTEIKDRTEDGRRLRDGNGLYLRWREYSKKHPITGKEVKIKVIVDEEGNPTSILGFENFSAYTLSQLFNMVGEGTYGGYIGDWIVGKAEETRKAFEAREGIFSFPPGSLPEAISKQVGNLVKLFDHLRSLAQDNWKRRPGVYYREDAYADLIKACVEYGRTEGRKFQNWELGRERIADVLVEEAARLNLFDPEKEEEIIKDLWGSRLERWLKSHYAIFTLPWRWGPTRYKIIIDSVGNFLKILFKYVFEGTPLEPRG